MQNPSFLQPCTPGAQAQPPAHLPQANTPPTGVPVTLPVQQQPVVNAPPTAASLLYPPATATGNQQTTAVTAAPLLGAGAGVKRNAPDSGFDQPIDGNDVRRLPMQAVPQPPGQIPPQDFFGLQPIPFPSSSSVGNMHVFGGHFNTGTTSTGNNVQFAVSTGSGSGLALPFHPGLPAYGMHSSAFSVPVPTLSYAVLVGDMQWIYTLLADPYTDVNIKDSMGYTALMHAATRGDLSLVCALISRRNINIHARNNYGYSAIDMANMGHHTHISQVLLAAIAPSFHTLNMVHSAHSFLPVNQGHTISLVVDANAASNLGLGTLPLLKARTESALAQAIEKDDLRTLRTLLADPEVDVNAKDELGMTALHHAVIEDNAAAVELLLGALNINVNASDNNGRTALLQSAYFLRESGIVRLLLAAHGIDLQARDKKGRTAFDVAMEEGNNAVIRPLFAGQFEAKGASVNARLALAAAKGDDALVEALLADPDVDVNATICGGNTALMLAAFNGHDAVVRRLLAAPGIDVNARDSDKNTALYLAAESGHEDVLRSMLAAPGIDINADSYCYGTPLRAAVRNGKERAVLALLSIPGIDMHVADTPALMDAAGTPGDAILGALLAMPGIDVNAKAEFDWTGMYWFPLIQAASRGYEANVRLLLAMPEIDINAIDGGDNTALLAAVRSGREPVVRALLAMPGVRIDVKDSKGRTALDIALKKGHEAIAQALQNHVPATIEKPASVQHFFQTVFATHSGEPQQSASSSMEISPSLAEAKKLDKLCESLQFSECTAADVPALFTSIRSLPEGARSALAQSLAFGFFTGHYRNADGALDEAIAAAIDKAGVRAAYDDAVEKLGLAVKHINLFHIGKMNLLGTAAKAGNERMIRGLVRLGAYVNVPSPNGKTALAIAVENRQWDACGALIRLGALPTLPLHDGYPALYHMVKNFASSSHSSESLAQLIELLHLNGTRFDIPVRNPDESMRKERPTVLLCELFPDNAQSSAKYYPTLGPKDAAPPAASASGNTAAILSNQPKVAQHGAQPMLSAAEIRASLASGDALAGFIAWLDASPRHLQWQDSQSGQGLLHLAAAGEHVEAVQLLLARGIDCERRDHMDRTPAQLLAPRHTTGLSEAARRIVELLRR